MPQTQISNLISIPDASVTGNEEYIVDSSGVTRKVKGSGIIKITNDDLQAYKTSNNTTTTNLSNNKLDKSGGTMTGLVTLSGTPTASLHAATKGYVDTLVAGFAPENGATFDTTTTGITQVNTVENTTLATTQYVGNKIEYDVNKKTTVASTPVTLTYIDRGYILVDHTTTAAVVINLPQISSITPNRTHYTILDSGNNAGTNNITINAFAGDTINGATSVTIKKNGGSLSLITKGSTKWYLSKIENTASETIDGTIELATTTEAKALINTSKAIVPSTAGAILDESIFKRTQIGAATFNVLESHSGILGVSYTSTGAVAINLPAISTLTNLSRVRYIIKDEGNFSSLNNITINRNGTDTIDGNTSLILNSNGDSVTLYPVTGGKWFVIKNTATTIGDTVKTVKLVIPTANVLTLNTVPLQLIPSPGTGKYIELMSATMKATFNTVAYATNLTLLAGNTSANGDSNKAQMVGSISFIANVFTNIIISTGGVRFYENEAVNMSVATGNPTAGNSDITIFATYRIVSL